VSAEARALETRGLVVDRGGTRVLHELDVEIERGSLVGLLGPSGCGKSTLMRAIVGVQIVAGGTITVLGEPAGSPSLRRRVAYVTQAPSVYGDLTVRENLEYFARVLGAREQIDAVIEAVGLAPHARDVARRLSGGELARVSLATALLGRPELLVLDEPTVGLDPLLRLELWERFRALAERGATLLVSSHVMDEAERCDRLLLMREGRMLASGSPAGLLERTGARDVESAFLQLIRAAERAPA
jgi:ABC-2 type transport system ATP-binding protein